MFTIWNWDRRIGTLHFIEAFTKFHRISSNHISSEFHRNFIGISSNFIELHRTSSLHRNFIESDRGSSRVFHVFIEFHRKVLQKVSGVHRTGFLFIESVRGSSKCSSTGIIHRNVHRKCQGFIASSSNCSSAFHRKCQGFIEGFIEYIFSSSRVSGVHRSVHRRVFFIEMFIGSVRGSSKCTYFIEFHRNSVRGSSKLHRNFIKTKSFIKSFIQMFIAVHRFHRNSVRGSSHEKA